MSILPQHEGPVGGLAPVEQGRDYAQEAKDQAKLLSVDDELHKFFLSLKDKYIKRDEDKWRSIKKQWVRSRNYFDNRQYGYVNNTYQWIDDPKNPGEVNYTKNIYQPHIQTALMEMSRGATELNFSYIAPDSQKGNLIKRVAESRYLAHKRRLNTSTKMDQENLSLLLNGLGVRYTYFEFNAESKVPSISDKQGTQEGAVICKECQAPMPVSPCRHCGSEESQELQSQINGHAIEYDSVPKGENKWVNVDPLGLTFDLSATTVSESPYWIWEQDVLEEVLQAKYAGVKIESGSDNTDKLMLDASTPNAQAELHQGKNNPQAKFTQVWLDVDLYGNYTVKQNTLLRNGRVIPANTKLRDAFPDGLYLAINGKTVLDAWNENKNLKWSAAPYVTRIGTLVGAGTSVALDAQDKRNDLENLYIANIMSNAFPWRFLNSAYTEGDQMPNDPREIVEITSLPDGGTIVGNVIDQLPGLGLSPESYGLAADVEGAMQMQLGTFSGSNAGTPDLKAVQDTALGFLAWRQMTVGRFAPMLAARADMLDKEQAYQLLENDQKYLTAEQWEEVAGDYGADAVNVFRQANLRRELVIEVVGESYMPQSAQDRQAKNGAFLQMIVEAQLDPNSEMAGYLANDFGIPTHLIGFDAHYNSAMSAVANLRQVVEMIVQQFGDTASHNIADPRVGQLSALCIQQAGIEISPLDNHPAIIDALKDWWIKDEGRQAPNLLKGAVTLYEEQLRMAQGGEMAKDAQLMMAAQAPQMEAQAQQEGQAQEAQQQQAEQEQGAQAVGMIADHAEAESQREEAEKQRQHEAQMKDKDIEMKRMDVKSREKAAKKKVAA